MNTHKILALTSICVLFAACDIKQDLGESADGSTSGSDSGSGGQTETTPVLDTGLPSETDSNSGPSGTSGSTSSASDTVEDTGTPTDTEDATTGGPTELCDESTDTLKWGGHGFDLLEAFGANSNVAAAGSCQLTISDPTETKNGTEVALELACVLDGEIDASPFTGSSQDLTVSLQTNLDPAALFSAFGETVDARIVVRSDGLEQGGERWIVLEQPALDGGVYPLLDLTDAYSATPSAAAIAGITDGPWHGGPSFSITDATCGQFVGSCGEFPTALEVGWNSESPIMVHDGEKGMYSSAFPETSYDVYPNGLLGVPAATCLDFTPHVGFVSIAVQP